jgi:uncharacterized membrane protein
MRKLLSGVATLAAILYPLVVYVGLTRFEPRYLAAFLGLVLLLKLASARRAGVLSGIDSSSSTGSKSLKYVNVVAAVGVLVLVCFALASNEIGSLKFYPAIVSFALLASFAWSLVHPPTVIERIARISEPDLAPAGVTYTRKITLVWCGFFICNGVLALYTALFTSIETWAFYNGFIAYVLIGSLLAGEYLYRYKFLKKG